MDSQPRLISHQRNIARKIHWSVEALNGLISSWFIPTNNKHFYSAIKKVWTPLRAWGDSLLDSKIDRYDPAVAKALTGEDLLTYRLDDRKLFNYPPTMFSGKMRKLVSKCYSKNKACPFSPTYNITHGLWTPSLNAHGKDQQRWIIEISEQGVFTWPVTLGFDFSRLAKLGLADDLPTLSVKVADRFDFLPVQDYEIPSKVVTNIDKLKVGCKLRLAPPLSVYGTYSALFPECGWAFNERGNKAVNVLTKLEHSGGTFRRAMAAYVINISTATSEKYKDPIPGAASIQLISSGYYRMGDDRPNIKVPNYATGVQDSIDGHAKDMSGPYSNGTPMYAWYDDDALRLVTVSYSRSETPGYTTDTRSFGPGIDYDGAQTTAVQGVSGLLGVYTNYGRTIHYTEGFTTIGYSPAESTVTGFAKTAMSLGGSGTYPGGSGDSYVAISKESPWYSAEHPRHIVAHNLHASAGKSAERIFTREQHYTGFLDSVIVPFYEREGVYHYSVKQESHLTNFKEVETFWALIGTYQGTLYEADKPPQSVSVSIDVGFMFLSREIVPEQPDIKEERKLVFISKGGVVTLKTPPPRTGGAIDHYLETTHNPFFSNYVYLAGMRGIFTDGCLVMQENFDSEYRYSNIGYPSHSYGPDVMWIGDETID